MVKLVENKINKKCLKMVAFGSSIWNIITGGSGQKYISFKTGSSVQFLRGLKRMRKSGFLLCMSLLLLIPSLASAQGVYRSFGIGFRTGIWKYRDAGNVRYEPGTVSSSSGGMVYFFARLVDRWHLEAFWEAPGSLHSDYYSLHQP